MQKLNKNETNKKTIKALMIGSIIGMVSTLLITMVFAFLITAFEINIKYASVFSTTALIIGSFLGACFSVRQIGKNGILYGSLTGLILFALNLIVSLILSNGSVTLSLLFHFLACVISGAVSGIITIDRIVNKKRNYGNIK